MGLYLVACSQLASANFAKSYAGLSAFQAEFSEAVATAEKALKLAQSLGQNGLAEKIKKHLELYKSGQPYQKLP